MGHRDCHRAFISIFALSSLAHAPTAAAFSVPCPPHYLRVPRIAPLYTRHSETLTCLLTLPHPLCPHRRLNVKDQTSDQMLASAPPPQPGPLPEPKAINKASFLNHGAEGNGQLAKSRAEVLILQTSDMPPHAGVCLRQPGSWRPQTPPALSFWPAAVPRESMYVWPAH